MAVPAWASFFDDAHWGHFVNLVGAALRERGLGHTLDGDAGCIRLSDGRVLGLSNLAQMCHQASWDRWPYFIGHHLGIALTATEGGVDEVGKDFEKSRALCKLRLWHRDAVPKLSLVAWDVADDLVAVLTLDLPEMLATVSRSDAERWPIAKADLWHLGLRNVHAEGILQAPALDVGEGAIVNVLEGDRTYFAASHLLFLEAYAGAAPLGCVVAVPRRHTVVFHRIVDQRIHIAIRSMLSVVPQMCHEGPGSISPSLYWWRPGQALMLLPSQQHGTTVNFYPPPPFAEVVRRLPTRA